MSVALVPARPRAVARWLPVVLWLALTLGLWLAARALPWRDAMAQLARVTWWWGALAVLANLVPLAVWAQEWRILTPVFPRVAYRRMFEVVTVMAAVLNSIPFFAGEASGVALLIARAGVSRGAALSVLAVDQLLGGVAKIVILGGAAMLVPLPSWLRAGILVLVVGVVALLVLLVPLAHRWESMRARLLDAPGMARRLIADLVTWGRHLEALRETRRLGAVAALVLGKKLVELLGILAVQAAFGLEPSLASAVLVLATLAIATMLPVAPANLGVYEAAVYAAYRYVGVSPEFAIGLAIVQHLCFLIPTLGTGYLMLTLRQVLPRAGSS